MIHLKKCQERLLESLREFPERVRTHQQDSAYQKVAARVYGRKEAVKPGVFRREAGTIYLPPKTSGATP